jgi:hypothetical protein
MTDTAAPTNQPPTTQKARSKGGVPRATLEVAESYAKAVWDTAKRSEAMPVIVARAITGKANAKAEGGAWREKPAAMRVYSLLARLNNGNLKLSPIGLALVDGSNPEGQKHARRQAVLGVASYLQLLTDHNGSPLPSENTVATTFEFQYEVPPASAKEAAVIFAESVKYAGLLDSNGNIQIDSSEVPDELEPETSTMPKAPKAPKLAGETASTPPATVTPPQPVAPSVGQTTFDAPPPPAAGAAVGVNVTIDMSKWQADDVLSVLKVLGYGDSSD